MTDAAIARAELLGGNRFTRVDRTPLLREMIERLRGTLEEALRPSAPGARVLVGADVLLSPQTAVIPDLTVFLGPTWDVPDLIVEYRAESTDRLFFGPKRLAYARALVREVWFADPGKRTVTALRLGSSIDYPWPAPSYGDRASIRSSMIPQLAVAVHAFFVTGDRAGRRADGHR